MNLSMRTEGSVLVVTIHDRSVDADGSPDLKARAGEALDHGHAHVVLDLAAVHFVDSSGLGAFLSLLKRLPGGGTLALAGVTTPVASLLRLTRIDRVLPSFDSVDEALGALIAAP